MGCGLGGGDWCVVQGITKSQIQESIFCEL